ncbi:MAG: TIGR02147 family protein [Bdellovibrionales bacterium]
MHPRETKSREQHSLKLPNLTNYLNFREYLSDFYAFQKSKIRGYTYAVFSARADIKSPNYLKLVVDAKRNLSESMIYKFARGLSLDKKQTEDFRLLVLYTQAKDGDERSKYLRDLQQIRVKHQLESGEINPEIWEKIPGWISWVVYELASQKNVDFSPENIQRVLRPRVRKDEIEKAIRKLEESGEIRVDRETNEVEKLRDVIRTPEEVPVALVKKIQAEFINLAQESLYNDSPKDREFGALTLCLDREEFERLKFDLRQLRKKYHRDTNVKRKEDKGERVYQFNVQLFALSDEILDS